MTLTRESFRKLIHSSGLLLWPLALYSRPLAGGAVLFVVAGYLLIERLTPRMPLLQKFWSITKRPHEMNTLSRAALALASSSFLLIVFFPMPAMACGLAQACISDTAAASIGRRWGKRKLPWNPRRSWVGTFAFFFSATLLCGLILENWFFAGALGLLGALVESASPRDWDNLLVPVITGAATWFASGLLI